MKRIRHPSSSDDSDNGSNSTCWSQHSSGHRRGTGQKPSEVFRTDLITAMKVHDSYQLNPEDYYVLADQWRQEWEKGVQVPVSPQSIPELVARVLAEKGNEVMFIRPKKLIRTSGTEALGYVDIRTLAEGMCRYDLNEEDVAWLQIINEEFAEMAMPPLDELTMERVMEEFERRCHDNMTHTVETEEGLGIEYDEDVVCDVCLSPDGEDNNEMVFCDKCNICVHQACYGIQKVPEGSWLCRICALGILPKCQLCPKKGGAMKPTRSGTKWVHVSCALWIPEVSIGNPEKMEPITNVSHIPSNRWSLICCLCKEKTGACIQCSAKNCRTAFHVTCGLHASLEMITVLTEDDEVKFKSFCPKHSGIEGTEPSGNNPEAERGSPREKKRWTGGEQDELSNQQQEKRVNLRKMKLQEMEEEFYQFVEVEEVAKHLKLSLEVVDFLYQYWKLKRKASFNQPLLVPKKDEEESLARREQEVLLRRLQLFTHLRQDLERVRNLTYMVTRREKMKRSLCKIHEQIFQHQVRLLDHELLNGNPSEKDLEKLFSPGCLSSQDTESGSPLSHSGLKPKRVSVKQKRRKSSDVKNPPDSSLSDKKPPETKDLKSLQTPEPAGPAGDAKVHKSHMRLQIFLPKLRKAEMVLGTFKLLKPESAKGPRRDSSGREDEELVRRKDEQEERGRMKEEQEERGRRKEEQEERGRRKEEQEERGRRKEEQEERGKKKDEQEERGKKKDEQEERERGRRKDEQEERGKKKDEQEERGKKKDEQEERERGRRKDEQEERGRRKDEQEERGRRKDEQEERGRRKDEQEERGRRKDEQEERGRKKDEQEERGRRKDEQEERGSKKDEQEERGRKRRSDVTESCLPNRFVSKHLEKTVSIRLVDIRNSESDERLGEDRTSRRSAVALNTKLNRPGPVPDAVPRTNGWLRNLPHQDSARPAAGHLKSWGKFRIPKRSDKPLKEEQEEAECRKPLLRPLTNTSEPSYRKTRLRAGTENEAGDGDLEPCLKQCHPHKLRGDSSLGRQYGSDVIRRGVLAS